MEMLKLLRGRIDDLSFRERGIVLLGIVAVIYFVSDLLVLEPLSTQQQRLLAELKLNNAELVTLSIQMEELVRERRIDPNTANKKKLQQLDQELTRLDEELQLTTAHLVPPKEMTKLLEMVLRRTEGLRLRKLTSLGTTALIANEEDKGSGPTQSHPADNRSHAGRDEAVSTAYRHGLRIEFSGDFPGTLNYLRKLEELEWKFYWDKIEFEVNEYPDSVGTISVFTISTDAQWIGV
jgi:MSHA biogenesis protein MshJ